MPSEQWPTVVDNLFDVAGDLEKLLAQAQTPLPVNLVYGIGQVVGVIRQHAIFLGDLWSDLPPAPAVTEEDESWFCGGCGEEFTGGDGNICESCAAKGVAPPPAAHVTAIDVDGQTAVVHGDEPMTPHAEDMIRDVIGEAFRRAAEARDPVDEPAQEVQEVVADDPLDDAVLDAVIHESHCWAEHDDDEPCPAPLAAEADEEMPDDDDPDAILADEVEQLEDIDPAAAAATQAEIARRPKRQLSPEHVEKLRAAGVKARAVLAEKRAVAKADPATLITCPVCLAQTVDLREHTCRKGTVIVAAPAVHTPPAPTDGFVQCADSSTVDGVVEPCRRAAGHGGKHTFEWVSRTETTARPPVEPSPLRKSGGLTPEQLAEAEKLWAKTAAGR